MKHYVLILVTGISSRIQIKNPSFGTQGSWVQILAPYLLLIMDGLLYLSVNLCLSHWVVRWLSVKVLMKYSAQHLKVHNKCSGNISWYEHYYNGEHGTLGLLLESSGMKNWTSGVVINLCNITELVKAKWELEPRCLSPCAGFTVIGTCRLFVNQDTSSFLRKRWQQKGLSAQKSESLNST